MGRGRAIRLAMGLIGLLVVALLVWVVVLRNKPADHQVREKHQLRVQVPDEQQEKVHQHPLPNTTIVETSGFHDLSFSTALTKARGEGKLVMAFFYTEASGPSMAMERGTWKVSRVREWLQATTIAVKINADKEPEFAVANGITGLPVMIFFSPDGQEVGRVVGYHPAAEFVREATAVVNRSKK